MISEAKIQQLLAKREIHLLEQITEEVARDVIAQLLFLQMEDAARPIKLFINSPGGSVPVSLAITKTIESITCPLHTVGIGMVGGTALMLLAAGTKGHRSALPECELVLMPIVGKDNSTETQRYALYAMNADVVSRLAQYTGVPKETITQDMEEGRSFSLLEARSYGLLDFWPRSWNWPSRH